MSKEQVFVTVQNRGLIALPSTIRHRFGLDKSGAQVEVIERDGEIILRPHVAVPVDQTWFWTERYSMLNGRSTPISSTFTNGRNAVRLGVKAES